MICILNYLRFWPILVCVNLSKNKHILLCDAKEWKKIHKIKLGFLENFEKVNLICWLLTYFPEFRNLVFYRIRYARFFKFLCNPLPTLYITTKSIGKGLFIQHGFSTIISAKKIGEYCWINQQVTIGHVNKDAPIIGNHVRIGAGAIVVGKVNIGDYCTVGAGTTVVKDIPSNTTVVGSSARIIKCTNHEQHQ